jgi:hypothetical protein
MREPRKNFVERRHIREQSRMDRIWPRHSIVDEWRQLSGADGKGWTEQALGHAQQRSYRT